MQEVFRLIERAGPSDKAVLIQGESGTGKELVARALHRNSSRAEKPLVTINCAALPEQLLESELFGHEKGAFTGAAAAKIGLFEMADGGTLFIDELGEMPVSMQVKLLRVLEDGSLRRVGSIQERRVDVRLITATNRDLATDVAQGRFREDLFYRVNLLSIDLPLLRDREGDVALLVSKLLEPDWEITKDALDALVHFHWPGNVRQLMNVVERAKILADDRTIQISDLPAAVLVAPGKSPNGVPSARNDLRDGIGDDLSQIQRVKITEVLHRERGNKSRAAKALGITRRALYRLLEKYEIH
jgi:transcriptional regulator with PAS, ATPase and Fis domain